MSIGNSWVWKEKNSKSLTFLLLNCAKRLNSFMIDPFNKLYYKIEFSCLYIPSAQIFISTLWLWTFLYFERISTFKQRHTPHNHISDFLKTRSIIPLTHDTFSPLLREKAHVFLHLTITGLQLTCITHKLVSRT